MIDPLRPYWPTNRSIAGLLVRSLCVLAAAAFVVSAPSRPLAVIAVLGAAIGQALFLALQWMELKWTKRSGLLAGGVVGLLFLSLVVVLVIESRSVLVASVR